MTDRPSLFDQIRRQPFLSADEERALARLSSAGDAGAADRLTASHLRLVVAVARRYRGSGLPLAELVQEGVVGLVQAVRRFDPEQREARLATYALWWVRASIQEYVIRSWSLVKLGTTPTQRALFLQLRRLLAGGTALGDDIAARLAARFETTVHEVRALARRMAAPDRSLDQRVTEDRPETWLDRLPAPDPNPEQRAAAKSEARRRTHLIRDALDRLNERERVIIIRRYLGEAMPSLELVAREIGLSKERVRQLERKALIKLRAVLTPALAEG